MKTGRLGTGVAYYRSNDPTGHTSVRILNDVESDTRSLSLDYAGSGMSAPLLVNGPTSEHAAVFTPENYPLAFGTNRTLAGVVSTNQNLILGSYTDAGANSGKVQINTTADAMVGLLIAGTTSATGDLQQWKKDSTLKAYMDPNGNLHATSYTGSGSGLTGIPSSALPADVAYTDAVNTFTARQQINSAGISQVPFTVQGANGQLQALTIWQDYTGSSVLAQVAADGRISGTSFLTAGSIAGAAISGTTGTFTGNVTSGNGSVATTLIVNTGTGTLATLGIQEAGATKFSLLYLSSNSYIDYTGPLHVRPGGVEAWQFTAAGHLLAATDNTYDIGASGATRPRNLYVAGAINGTTGVFSGAVSGASFTGSGSGLTSVPDSALTANIALLNRNPQTFTGANTFSATLTGAAANFSGAITGTSYSGTIGTFTSPAAAGSQIFFLTSAGHGGTILANDTQGDSYFAANLFYTGSAWNRFDTTSPGWIAGGEPSSDRYAIYHTASGANPASLATPFTLSGGGNLVITGTLTAGSGPTTITDSVGKILSAALNTVGISQGGSGQVTANASLNAFLPSQTGNATKALVTDGSNTAWTAVGTGTVTSVGLSLPAEFSITVSPVTASGTLTAAWAAASGNKVIATPADGSSGAYTGRSLAAADIPSLDTAKIGSGTLGTIRGGTGLSSYILGDLPYASAANTLSTLAGNTSTTLAVLTQTGNGTISAAPAWTSTTGSGSIARATSPTLVTPLLGTPTSGTLTNCTGLPISTGISGLGSGIATFLATPSSANLAAAITDETGTGSLVFSSSPALGGTPTAPTATAGTNTTQIATTAFVTTAVGGGGGTTTVTPLFDQYTDAATSHTNGTEDALYSNGVTGSVLATDGDKIEAEYAGTFSGSPASRHIRVSFGGQDVTNTGSFSASPGVTWGIRITLIRVNSGTVRCSTTVTTGTSTFSEVHELGSLSLSGSNDLNLYATSSGAGAASGDITATMGYAAWMAHA